MEKSARCEKHAQVRERSVKKTSGLCARLKKKSQSIVCFFSSFFFSVSKMRRMMPQITTGTFLLPFSLRSYFLSFLHRFLFFFFLPLLESENVTAKLHSELILFIVGESMLYISENGV
jgi:hypothetical protein